MGNGDHQKNDDARPSTALLVLAALMRADRPLTTYEIGLSVSDDHVPPRPISVIVKSLAKDKYIVRSSYAGKRTGRWTITDRARSSVKRRTEALRRADDLIESSPSRTPAEEAVLAFLATGPSTLTRIVEATGLTTSPARTALRRLIRRGDVVTEEGRRHRLA